MLVGAWFLLIAFFIVTNPAFRQSATLEIIIGTQATQLVVTLAVVVALIGGEFDLSVANVLGAAASGLVYFNATRGMSVGLALALVILMVLAFGALNALLVIRVGIPSVIVTLGTGTLLSGIWTGVAGSSPVNGVSSGFVSAFTSDVLGLPVSFYVAIGIALLLWYVLQHTPGGRYFAIVGRNRDVARLAGLSVNQLRALSLIGCSLLAALAGILLVGQTGASDPTVASDYLLPAFAGAFLGSTAIRPGEFNIWGSAVAVYFLVTGITGLELDGYSGWVENVFYGGSLVVAVALTQIVARHRSRGRDVALF